MTRWLRVLDRRPVAELVVVGAYVLAAAWAVWIVGHPDDLTIWYPPAGVAVAAVAVGGRRHVLSVLLAEAIVAVAVLDLADELGGALTAVHVLAVGGSYAAVGLVLRWVRVDVRLPDLRHLGLLLGILSAGAVPAAVAGTTIRRAADVLDDSHLSEALTWFKIDVLGLLVLVPAVLLAAAPRDRAGGPVPRPTLTGRLGTVEVASVLAVPAAAAALAGEIDLLYLVVVPVLLVAWRRAQPGASVAAAATVVVLTSTLAITDGTLGDGALADGDVSRRDVVALVAVLAVAGVVAGLAGADRFRLARRHDHLVAAVERTAEVVVLVSLDGTPRWWNRAANRFVARRGPDGRIAPIDHALAGGSEWADRLAGHAAAARTWAGEHLLVATDGEEVPVSLEVVPDLDEHLTVSGYTLFARRSPDRPHRAGGSDPETTGRHGPGPEASHLDGHGGANGRADAGRAGDRREEVEALLRQVLEDHALPLRFRPGVDLRTGDLVDAEARLHLCHDELGPVPPTEVRDVARAAGLLGELDHLTAQTAAAIAATWPAGTSVSVGVSADRLGDGTWYRITADALHSSGLAPSRLVLAVVEDAFAGDAAEAIAELRRCRELGVRVALDDLGAGRSSLATLRTVPVDVLGLAPALLDGLGTSPAARAVAGAVLGVAEVLELTVVACDVDTDEQLVTARSLGCHLARGDRFGRPVPADALEAFRAEPARTP